MKTDVQKSLIYPAFGREERSLRSTAGYIMLNSGVMLTLIAGIFSYLCPMSVCLFLFSVYLCSCLMSRVAGLK